MLVVGARKFDHARDGQALALGVEVSRELAEARERRAEVHVGAVEKDAEERVRGARVVDDLVGEEHPVHHLVVGDVRVARSEGLFPGAAVPDPAKEKDEPEHARLEAACHVVHLLHADPLHAVVLDEEREEARIALQLAPFLGDAQSSHDGYGILRRRRAIALRNCDTRLNRADSYRPDRGALET